MRPPRIVWPRPTLRVRLTLLFVAQFVAAAAVVLALTWLIYQRDQQPREPTASAVAVAPPLPAPTSQAPSTPPPGYSQQIQRATANRIVTEALEALVVIAVGAVGVGWWLAGRVLRPIRKITSTARRLSGETLHERVGPAGLNGATDELKELAGTFDAMLARLEVAFTSQRRFSAHVSHELRTPMGLQRTLVDVALAEPNLSRSELGKTLAGVRDALVEQERIVDGLMTLARSERGIERPEPVERAAVAERALTSVEAEAAEREVRIERQLAEARVSGDLTLLERMVGNLVENAIRYNERGGWVRVSLRPTAGGAAIEVANTGMRVAGEILPRLGEPFTRQAPPGVRGRDGLGLGLSVVRAVAGAHGGTMTIAAREGGGLLVRVTVRGRLSGPSTISAVASRANGEGESV